MARTADPINPLCQASAGEFHSGLQTEISRETEPPSERRPPESGSMNCDLLRWAADQTKISPHLQGILVRLVRLMDDDGVLAMKQAEIAPLIGIGERQTRAAIAALVDAKVINRKRRGGLGGGRVCDALICNRPEKATGETPPLSAQPAEIAKCDNGGCSPLATGGKAQPAIGGMSPLSSAKSATGDNAVELPVSEILDAEFVDNSPAPYKGTGARAEELTLNTLSTELYSEQAELVSESVREVVMAGGGPFREEWVLGTGERAFAHGQGLLNGSVDRAFAMFGAHHMAKGTITVNWRGEWKKWVLREAHDPRFNANNQEKNHNEQSSSTAVPDVRVRREPVSPATAARMQRQARREAQRGAIDIGRVDSERVG